MVLRLQAEPKDTSRFPSQGRALFGPRDERFRMSSRIWARREWLKLLAKGSLLVPLKALPFASFGGGERASRRYFRADAVIMLFSIPIFSKAGVGSGFAFVEELEDSASRTRRLGFGGGSWPDKAAGLNRLGYIHETVVESSGNLAEAKYFGFMSTSQEERLEEARAALNKSQQEALFSAIRGETKPGAYSAQFTRFLSRDAVSWRLWQKVADAAEKSFDGKSLSNHAERGAAGRAEVVIPTLLYSMLRVRETGFAPLHTTFIYGGVERSLETSAAPDPKMGDKLRQRGIVANAKSVVHVTGLIRNLKLGTKTRFSVWWDRDSASPVPVRIELEPKSYLRLAFEADREPPSNS